MCATILVQILYLTRHVLQFMLQSRMCVSMYVHAVQSSRYDSQIKELLWHESNSPALCRFWLPTQPTNTFQLLQMLCHTRYHSRHLYQKCTLMHQSQVWVSRVHIKLEYLVSYATHLKDFMFC